MADIFEQNPIISDPLTESGINASIKQYTGNREIDAYIDSLPEEEREDAVKQIVAPKTGAEVWADMLAADKAKVKYDPSYEDWLKYHEYKKNEESDVLDLLTTSGAHIYELFTKGAEGAMDEPSKIPRSTAEAFAQGTKTMYGMLAMSQNSASPQARFFNAINGVEENSQEAYNEFLRAREVNRELNDLWDGTKTMIMDKDLINHDFVQAAGTVADPSFLVPFGKIGTGAARFIGMGEKALILGAKVEAVKAKILGGAIKWGVGAPIEMFGRATRGTIDFGIEKGGSMFETAIGVSAKEFEDTVKSTMRVGGIGSVGAGAVGYSIPYASSITGAYTLGGAAVGVGEAIGAVGNSMMRGPRGFSSYAADALKASAKEGAQLSNHARNLLKIIDKFDPFISYVGAIGEGSFKGGTIGSALGYWSDGRNGFWSGMGAGMALGSVGAGTGKAISDIVGATRDLHASISAKYIIEAMKDMNPEEAMHWENAQIFARANGFNLDGIIAAKDRIHPDTSIRLYDGNMYDKMLIKNGIDPKTKDGFIILPDGEMVLGKRQFSMHNGFVIENKATGGSRIYINAESAGRPTLGHEIFHSLLRTSPLRHLYIKSLQGLIIGERDETGKFTNRPVVDWNESKQFFRRYLKAEAGDDAKAYQDSLARLEMAEKAYEKDGTLLMDADLGRPMLEHLSEEFGSYYYSHMLMDKPIDWMYKGGELGGIRGALESATMMWLKHSQSRVGDVATQFNFNRTFKDPVTGLDKPVTIDQVFAPLKKGIFGQTKTERIINPALESFFKDVMRMQLKVNETGGFDISKMSKDSQKAFIEGNGLDGVYEKGLDGNYKPKSEAQIKKENRLKAKEVHKLLMSVPANRRTFKIDAEGNIRGPFSDEILDLMVNSGHVSREMVNKIRLFQNVAEGKMQSNVVDFGGIGATMETIGDVSNPQRVKGKLVPFKMRTGVAFGVDIKISANGEFQFKANMLDYDNIQTRANNTWSNPVVQMLWRGNHTDYMTDLYRYLENASKTPSEGKIPSENLWVDGKGADRRNALHQVMGMAKGEADVYLNSPSGEIARNHLSTVFSFSINRMTHVRLRDQKMPFVFNNAYNDIKLNFHPNEGRGEETVRGTVYKHPSGYTFLVKKPESQRSDSRPYGSVEVYDDRGIRLGLFDDMQKASEAALKNARKNPPMVLNHPDNRGTAFGNEAELRHFAADRGYNHLGYVHATEAKNVNVFDLHFPTKNRGKNPAGIYFRSRGALDNISEMKTFGPNLVTAHLSIHNPWGLDGNVYNKDGTVARKNKITPELLQDLRFLLQKVQSKNSALSDAWVEGKVAMLERTKSFTQLQVDGVGPYELRDLLVKHGYDGLNDGMDMAVFFPEQIKSDKLVTHDANGIPIPKAERFDRRSASINRSPNEGRGELPIIDSLEADEARKLGNVFLTKRMQEFVGDRKVVPQTADEGFIDFIKNFKEGDINQQTALMMLDEMSKEMFGGLDRQTKRLRLEELTAKSISIFEKENSKFKGLYKSLPDRHLKTYLSLSEYAEYNKLESDLAKKAPDKQLHSQFTINAAKDFAKSIEDAKKWVKKANPQYNDFAGYIAENIPMREYYQHAVYSRQFRTGEPVVVVGVHGTKTSEGFLKDKKYVNYHDPRSSRLASGEMRGAFFASSDATVLSKEYQGYSNKSGYDIAKSAIRFDNPLVVDGQFTDMMKPTEKILGEAIDKGHDGVIYINQMDGGGLDVSFFVPVDNANYHQRMIGSTRDKSIAGASYEPLPRGKGITNRTVNLHPNEGAGEAVNFRSTKKFEPQYKDSYIGYGGYYLPVGADPFPMIDIRDYDKGFDGKPIKLSPNNMPHASKDTLYTYMRWHLEYNKPLYVKDILTFLDQQGSSVHSNIARSYWSNWAKTMLSLGSQKELNRRITLGSGKESYASTIETVLGLKQSSSTKTHVDPRKSNISLEEVERLEAEQNNKKKKEDGEESEPEDVGDEFGDTTSTGRLEKTGEEQKLDKAPYTVKFARAATQTFQHLTLQQIVDKMFDRERNIPEVSTKGDAEKGNLHTTISTSQSQLIRKALSGHSFEGVALEEIFHSFETRINSDAVNRDSSGWLKQIVSQGEGNVSGRPWQIAVENFIKVQEDQVRNDPTAVDPILNAYARMLKLQVEVAKNTFAKNTKNGKISNMWDSSVVEHNANYIKVDPQTGEVKLKSGRNKLKKNWEVLWPEAGSEGTQMSPSQMALDMGQLTSFGISAKGLNRGQSAYRFKYPHEFFIILMNDSDMLSKLTSIKYDPNLLSALDTEAVKGGFSPNVASLHNQMSMDLARFVSVDGQPRYSMVNQMLEEAIRIMDLNRRGSHGLDLNVHDESTDIKRVSLGLNRDNPTAFLPERPHGVITDSEKNLIAMHRTALEAWKAKGKGENFLEGLSDWEAWQELKNHPDNEAHWRWFYGPEQGGTQFTERAESQVIGVKDSSGWISEGKGVPPEFKRIMITNEDGILDVIYVDENGNVWDVEKGQIDKKKTRDNKSEIQKRLDKENENNPPADVPPPNVPPADIPPPNVPPADVPPPNVRITHWDTSKPPEANQPPVPMPARNVTAADFRVWRDWIPMENNTKGFSIKNSMNYIIMSLNNKYRVYNPYREVIGVYDKLEDAKRRVERNRPKT